MNLFIHTIYFFLILFYLITFSFIVYHLVKYSINASLNRIVLPFFAIVSILFLISNLLLFFSIDWQEFFLSMPISFN